MRHVSGNFKVLAAAAAGVVLSAIPALAAPTISGPYDLSSGFGSPTQFTPAFVPTGVILDPIYNSAITYGGVRYRRLSNNGSQDVVVGVGSPTSPSGLGGNPIQAGGANQTTTNFPTVAATNTGPYVFDGSTSVTVDYTPAGGVLPAYLDTLLSLPAGSTSVNGTVSQTLAGGTPAVATSFYNLPSPYQVTLAGANGILNNLRISLASSQNGPDGNPATVSLNNVNLSEGGGPLESLGSFSAANNQLGTNEIGNTTYNPAWEVTNVNLNNGFELTGTLVDSDLPLAGGSESQKVEVAFGAVPEPGSLSLLGIGAMSLLGRRRANICPK